MKSLISIIIPIYNSKRYLYDCIQSVQKQTYPYFEVLMVDDGSSDGSREICEAVIEKDERFRLFMQEHKGVSAARNKGMEASRGEYLFFLDSDDEIHPRLLEALYKLLDSLHAVMAGGGYCSCGIKKTSDKWAEAEKAVPVKYTHLKNEEALACFPFEMQAYFFFAIGGKMIRRDAAMKLAFNKKLKNSEDTLFIYRLLSEGADAAVLHKNWYYYRKHEDNASEERSVEAYRARYQTCRYIRNQEWGKGRTGNAIHWQSFILRLIMSWIFKNSQAADGVLRRYLYHILAAEKENELSRNVGNRVKARVFLALRCFPLYKILFLSAAFCMAKWHREPEILPKQYKKERVLQGKGVGMKKICFFSGDITRSGGTERAAAMIANGLAGRGKYRIVFLSLVEECGGPFFEISPQIERYVLKKDGGWISPGPGYLPLLPRLRDFLAKQRIDVVVDIDIVLDALSIPASLGTGVKVISWEHFHYHFEQNIWYRKAIVWATAHFSDYIITLTEQDKQDYQKYGRRKGKIDFIYNPADLRARGEVTGQNAEEKADQKTKQQKKMLITAGGLNHRKGTDLLAQVAPAVLRKYEDWKWYVLGDGECRGVLEAAIERHHLEGRLILTGTVSHIEEYWKDASIGVMTSRAEGLPMSLLEAKAARIPCVCFDIRTGPAEIITNGVNGFLIPPFDLVRMVERIGQLIENETLYEQFVQNTSVGMEKFALGHILEKWEKLLEVCNGRESTD